MSWIESILRSDRQGEPPECKFRRIILIYVTGGHLGTLPTPEELLCEFKRQRVVSLPNIPNLASRLTFD